MASPTYPTMKTKPTLVSLPAELQVDIASHLKNVDDLIQLKRSCRALRDIVGARAAVLAPPLTEAQHARLRTQSEQKTFTATKIGMGGTDVMTKEGRLAMGLPRLKEKRGWGYALMQGGELERLRTAADGDEVVAEGVKRLGAELMVQARFLELVEILRPGLYCRAG
ncbi:hypothetical protein LTR35_004205 [Friedmanniomyces endolithicus]|uniref:F-box domain-containing protein n=1 Tax=Friedmanniomyces endolithicus TaxID=329885 RepID=A0AAN6FYF5_9PEZI|nr:hypothetical protein LTR35_004205 [Friedmanniomyces endolithicus]KAK0294441.1 hypothetical protein LTS00_007032 [Friedmanniomyces endolithicus]KAK0326705.1 hypothetical protein LTR82_002547 [Friedmanniomyces endolithicus]KAK1017658.1 hypothetical protein LTR54_002316 [Friedmanniomyces endolithicus]